MAKKVVIYSLKWIGTALVGQPRPVLVAEPAAANLLKNVIPETPAWVEEKDLSRYGFDVVKKEANAKPQVTEAPKVQAEAPKVQAEAPKKPVIKSVEQLEQEQEKK